MTAQEIAQNAFTAEIQDRYELQAAIEAYAESLVAECREQTVRECAEAAVTYIRNLPSCGLVDAILSVAAPKPPVWQQDIENLQQRIDSLQQDLDTLKAKR